MKPIGPLPPEFAGQTGALRIAGQPYTHWIGEGGDTPCFAYDGTVLAGRVIRFRAAFPGIALHYAIKANPFPPLLAEMAALVDGLDVASGGELATALPHGLPISFAGPGKRDDELAAAIRAGVTINLESDGEATRALGIADRLGTTPKLAVRVNPAFGLRGSGMRMGGLPSPFGVDAEEVPALVRRLRDAGAEWRGFHVYAGSQSLDTGALIETQAATLALARELADAAGAEPPLVNLGGGFGVPYFAGDEAIDIAAIGDALVDRLDAQGGNTRHAIELGRWLVAECGVYLTRVIDRKQSRGETFLVVDGGLHHQLAASGNFGTVVRRNYPVAVAGRMGAEADDRVSVVGCLCTPLDRLADRVVLPRAEVGDVIAIFMAGAYGLTASPAAFLGHPVATQVFAQGQLHP